MSTTSYFGRTATAAGAATPGTSAVTPDNATAYASPTSFNNVPTNQMGPDQSYSAWAITDPNSTVYTGDPTAVPMSHNQIMGALADKFGIKARKGVSLDEQVLQAVAKITGTTVNTNQIKFKNGKAQGPVNADQQLLGAVTSKLGLDSSSATPWADIAKTLGVSTTKAGNPTTAKVTDLAAAFKHWGRADITRLQGQLYHAGYFASDVQPGTSTGWTPGNIDVQTQQAIGQLLQDTAHANANGAPTATWSDVLGSQTAMINAQGGIDALVTKNKTPITVATQAQLTQPAITAFEAKLGRTPTSAELSQLTGTFDAAQQAHAGDIAPGGVLFPDSNAILQVPGVPTATQAAANQAMNSDGNEYQGHQIANAVALVQNAMVANRPLGADPNLTSAARPL